MGKIGRPPGSKNKPKSTKQTQASKPSTRTQEVLRPELYRCTRCGKMKSTLRGTFPKVRSPLYVANEGYLTVCARCIDELYEHYVAVLGDEEAAMRRMCSKFDIYYSDLLFQASGKRHTTISRIRNFIVRSFGQQYKDSYDDTLDEENVLAINSDDDVKEKQEKIDAANVSQKTLDFFGLGYTPYEYKFLQEQYDDWVTRHECNTKSQEELFKTLCIAQLNIQKAQMHGGKISEAMKVFQDLLGTANLKPNQASESSLADEHPFGVLIKEWEDHDPIPEPSEEFKDVDGIVRYITVYFLGHLCKMMGLKNRYSKLYEAEMAKYAVERPQYEDDEEALFDAVFGANCKEGLPNEEAE